MDYHIIKADWSENAVHLKRIRTEVFVEEQNVPRELEWDGEDASSTHFLAVNEAGQYIGCARLMQSGQIGRMAVQSTQRSFGVGARLLEACVTEGKLQGFQKLFLHAQTYAEDFYRKGGFVSLGDTFEEAGIEHTTMEMMLPIPFEASPTELPKPSLRATSVANRDEVISTPHPFDGQEEALLQLQQTIESATRRICILSPYLDHILFAEAGVVDLLSRFARKAPLVDIKVLLMSSKRVVDRGHPLLELARRLDQNISIRWLDEKISEETSTFVCADAQGYWLMPAHEQFEGVADLGNAVTANKLYQTFKIAWGKSKEDPELRELRI